MTPSAIADSIVNLCGAIGLAVAMLALHRRDPGGPFTRRLFESLFRGGSVELVTATNVAEARKAFDAGRIRLELDNRVAVYASRIIDETTPVNVRNDRPVNM